MLVIIIAIATLFYSKNEQKKQIEPQEQKQTTQTQHKQEEAREEVIIEETKKEKEEEREEVVLESKTENSKALQPAMGFLRDMQNSSQPRYEMIEDIKEEVVLESSLNTQKKEDNTKAPKDTKSTKESFIQEAKIEIVEIDDEKEKSKKINISRKNTQNDIAEVIKRFKKNSSPALSLFIAKKYYEIGDYHNAYNYALTTNEINRDIESSWIIFCKSLVKLGKKEMAIKTLQEYTKETESDAAKILLDEITSGKFK